MENQAQNLSDAVASLMQGRPTQKTQNIPMSPKVAPIFSQSQDKNTAVSLLVGMTYQSLSENIKNRDILIRRILKSKGEYYIEGVAMDIRAPRLIKVSHIKEIRDAVSGRVYQNPFEFLSGKFGITDDKKSTPASQPQSDFSKVVERTGHEMTVLMYLIAIDGSRDKRERDKAFAYIKSRTTDLNYDENELMDYLISLAPDEECFRIALEKILKLDVGIVQKLLETILDIIMADGKIDKRERVFLSLLMGTLEQEGYDISLPI